MNALVSLPLARFRRSPRAWIPIILWSLFAVGAAVILHRASPSGSASEALLDPFGGLALPLLAYAVVGTALGGDGLPRSTRSLVAFGASPFRTALATVMVAAAVTAALGCVVGVLVAALGHSYGDPPVLRDAFTTAWVALLGGAAYACAFALGASFGKHGGGRVAVLAIDFALGSNDGALSLVTPRAHLRSLLGGEAVEHLPGKASALALVVLAVTFAWLAALRTKHARRL